MGHYNYLDTAAAIARATYSYKCVQLVYPVDLSVKFTTPTEIEYNAVNDSLVQDMLWSDVLMLQDIILCFQYIISSLRLQLTVAQWGITMRFAYKYCVNY